MGLKTLSEIKSQVRSARHLERIVEMPKVGAQGLDERRAAITY